MKLEYPYKLEPQESGGFVVQLSILPTPRQTPLLHELLRPLSDLSPLQGTQRWPIECCPELQLRIPLETSNQAALERRPPHVLLIALGLESAVLSQLVEMNGVDDKAIQPDRLVHRLLCELSQGVAVLLGCARGDLERPLGVRIVGSEQNPVICLDGKHAVSGGEAQPLHHFLGECRADRSSCLPQFQVPGHSSQCSILGLLPGASSGNSRQDNPASPSTQKHRHPHHSHDVRPVSLAIVELLHVHLLLAFAHDVQGLGGVAAALDGDEAAGFAGED
jgi:hypothetical protein